MRLTGLRPRVAALLIALLAAVAASALPAGPAAAATTPTCAVTSRTSLGVSASCTNGDPAIPYRLGLLCWLGRGNPYDVQNGILVFSAWTPTTQPINNFLCFVGGPILAFVDVGSPPPPPSANLSCESGNRSFFCDVSPELTGSLSITWYINDVRIAAWDDRHYISGGCETGTKLRVIVTNSTASASGYWSSCRTGPWQ